VQYAGEIHVAQYGQWDGYLTGQGQTVQDFLKNYNRNDFLCNLQTTVFIDGEIDGLDELSEDEFHLIYPGLSRNTGADVLQVIETTSDVLLVDSYEFRKDTLFCEYHYYLNFDTDTISIFTTNAKTPEHEYSFTDFCNLNLKELEQ
jgi:hypothetical protein